MAKQTLNDLLSGTDSGSMPAPEPKSGIPDIPTPPPPPPRRSIQSTSSTPSTPSIQSIEVEAVVNGALMRVTLSDATPAEALALLRECDPNAQFRTEFPRSGRGGSRDTKSARAVGLMLNIRDSFKGIDIIAVDAGGQEITVSVSKAKAETWPADVAALGRLTDDQVERIRALFERKGTAPIMLADPQQFGVDYWTADDGKSYLDKMTPEPPVAKAATQEAAS